MKSWRDAPLADEQKTKTKKSWRDAPLADEAAAGRAPAPVVETPASISKRVGELPSFDISKPGTYLPGAARAVLEVPVGLERGVQDVAETVLSPLFPTGQGTVAEAERNQFRQQFSRSPTAKGGRFVGQAVMTAPVGGFLGAGAERLGLNALANSLRSGGFVTGATPTGVFGGISNVATRAAGGAVTGGTQAALVGDDATTGAVAGAALPALGVPLAKGVGSALGNFFDAATGQLGKVRASGIMRDVLGPDFDKAIQILKNAPSNVTPEQALVAGGIPPERIKGFIALGEWSAKRDPKAITDMLRTSQTAGRQALLDIVSGGTTEAERIGAQRAATGQLQQTTAALREKALGAAREITARMQSLSKKIGSESKTYEGLTKEAESLTKASDDMFARAAETAQKLKGKTGPVDVSPEGTVEYSTGQDLKGSAAMISSAAKNAKRRLDAAQKQLAALEQKGLKPLQVNNISASISKMLQSPKIGVSDANVKALNKVIQKLDEWSDPNGIIDADALYEIRKSTITETISELLGGKVTAATEKARAASLLAQIKPLIDGAIIQAGGADWGKYLRAYSEGAREIERLQMAGEAANLFRTNPTKYVDLVSGNDTKTVSDIFGGGVYDFESAMDPTIQLTGRQKKPRPPAGPDRRVAMREVAEQLKVDEKIAAQAARGYDRLQEAFRSVEPRPLGLPSLLSRTATVANVALDALEKRFGKDTIDTLITSMREGKGVVEAVSVLPANERNAVIRFLSGTMELKTPTAKAAAAAAGSAATKGAATAAAPPNAMNQDNRNAMRPR